jgi:hypothetical protein
MLEWSGVFEILSYSRSWLTASKAFEMSRDTVATRRCPACRLLLVKANGSLGDQKEESSNGTMHNLISVLSGKRRKRLKDKGEKKMFQDFHSRG